uniref:Uncharacterized protein n=1 Tax=Anguilla anguilla TaxID=7936 RepID=A0A0E9TRE0_ANGAN
MTRAKTYTQTKIIYIFLKLQIAS